MESRPPIRLHLFMLFVTFTHSFSISNEFTKLGENENIAGHVSKQYKCSVPTWCAIG